MKVKYYLSSTAKAGSGRPLSTRWRAYLLFFDEFDHEFMFEHFPPYRSKSYTKFHAWKSVLVPSGIEVREGVFRAPTWLVSKVLTDHRLSVGMGTQYPHQIAAQYRGSIRQVFNICESISNRCSTLATSCKERIVTEKQLRERIAALERNNAALLRTIDSHEKRLVEVAKQRDRYKYQLPKPN